MKNKMAHFYIQQKRNKKNQRTVQGCTKKITFRMQNTIQNIVKHHPRTAKYNRSGIYQMKCLDCPLKYIGQTGRTFHSRYKEHILAIRNSNSSLGYSSHILNTRTYLQDHNRCSRYCKNTEKRITFKHIRKIQHVKNN
jgi:hypothetical protein